MAKADAHENETLTGGNGHATTSMGHSPEDRIFRRGRRVCFPFWHRLVGNRPSLRRFYLRMRLRPPQFQADRLLRAHTVEDLLGAGSATESGGRLRSEGDAAEVAGGYAGGCGEYGRNCGTKFVEDRWGEPGKRGFTPDEVFSTLDSAPNGARPEWRHASGTHAEAGFNDPALGWVGVRAEKSGTNVQATLVPSSEPAADALQGHVQVLIPIFRSRTQASEDSRWLCRAR